MATTVRRRTRGTIRKRGDAYQVVVYAGLDPLTGKEIYLYETTKDRREAEQICSRLLAKVDGQRTAATRVTVAYALDEWLTHHEAEQTTVEGYRGYIERTIKPALGDVPLAKLSAHPHPGAVLRPVAQMPGAVQRQAVRRPPNDRSP